MSELNSKDPFTKFEWYLFRCAFAGLLVYEVAKFVKFLLEHW